jgi:hypothetical protein
MSQVAAQTSQQLKGTPAKAHAFALALVARALALVAPAHAGALLAWPLSKQCEDERQGSSIGGIACLGTLRCTLVRARRTRSITLAAAGESRTPHFAKCGGMWCTL